jgi:ElaB/YqjD/DUF883 family membrane-anchored ribosome-binding protein
MAEERNLATARAPELVRDDIEPTKEELQRRMEEARESISQTVNEIKETVTTKYEDVRESISQTLDWREQFRRRPVAFAVGAAGVGLILGYSVGGVAFGEGGDDLTERYYEAEGDYDEDGTPRTPQARSYAAQAITGGAYGSSAYAPPSPNAQASAGSASQTQYQPAPQDYDAAFGAAGASPAPRPSYSSGYESSLAETEPDDDKPSLFSRFKETKAYDRLQDEVGNLGNRFVEELSKTAQSVVLPALLGKLKDLIGIDLSTQREVAQRSRLEQETSTARKVADNPVTGAATSGGTNYGTGTGGYGKML